MHIESLTLSNFRCFGPEPRKVSFEDDLTAIIGANGAGKTAVMQGLLRLFGSPDQRRIRANDFHVPKSESLDTVARRSFVIEAQLAFPELLDPDGDHRSVPPFFKHLLGVASEEFRCRVTLEAKWTRKGQDGDIDEDCWAIKRASGDPENGEKKRLANSDRSQVSVIYVPAARDATHQVSSLLRGRLWKALKWSDSTKSALKTASSSLRTALAAEGGVDAIQEKLGSRWSAIHGDHPPMRPIFNPIESDFDKFTRDVGVVLKPDETGRERSTDEMSDGERSIFHLSLTAASLDIESSTDPTERQHFDFDDNAFPLLTVLAIEEPENNLAPFYLSRIVSQVQEITAKSGLQAVISSHSPSVLNRIDPTKVRHLRLEPKTRTATVNSIKLPQDDDEAAKYVREAVRAYPELYFASFVILGEGSSEEVVLPRIADALGLQIDRSFVAVVPLGGRHVDHLWRLLNSLDVPHATLLDLDLGRQGGGFGRILGIVKHLVSNGRTQGLFDDESKLTYAALEQAAATKRPDEHQLQRWVTHLESFSVYFCQPVDLDMTMLTSMPEEYKKTAGPGGPSSSGDPIETALGEGWEERGGREDLDYVWYRYLFLGKRGKPSTHTKALAELSNQNLQGRCPPALDRLLKETVDRIAVTLSIRAK